MPNFFLKALLKRCNEQYPNSNAISVACFLPSGRSFVPRMAQWYKGRACLIGDAAHGISPHIGQGASLALEDTVVITAPLKLHKDYSIAFQIFQSERQPRIEKVIKSARKVGDTKTKTNPIAAWFRDRLISFFTGKQIQQLDWIYDWTYSHKNSRR